MTIRCVNPCAGTNEDGWSQITSKLLCGGIHIGELALTIGPGKRRTWRAVVFPNGNTVNLETQSWKALRRQVRRHLERSLIELESELTDAEKSWSGRGNEPVSWRDVAEALRKPIRTTRDTDAGSR